MSDRAGAQFGTMNLTFWAKSKSTWKVSTWFLKIKYNMITIVWQNLLDTIDEASALTLDVPVNEFDGKVVYGEKNMKNKLKLTGHFNELEPKLKMLRQAEKLSQTQFIMLSQRQAGLIQHW